MALPKIDQPLFEIEIPSTGKKARYRPFTVKEEKILLIAQESREQNQILLAVCHMKVFLKVHIFEVLLF